MLKKFTSMKFKEEKNYWKWRLYEKNIISGSSLMFFLFTLTDINIYI